jgi:signal transduction histidine kinase
MPTVHERAIPFDSDIRERLIEAARLATVGRLVASFVHQISTPLAAISLRAESLEQSGLGAVQPAAPDKARRYLQAIGEEASRCRQLLGALREFGGPLDAQVEPVDLAALCRSAALLVRDEAVRRQVEVELRLEEPLAPVRGVKGRLGQAVMSLLLNAVEASPVGASVVLEARASGQEALVLSVSDEGAGLPSELGSRLFEPFVSSRPPTGGLGLGLMACRAVAEAHGGRLEARTEGTGGRAMMWLPLAGVGEGISAGDADA